MRTTLVRLGLALTLVTAGAITSIAEAQPTAVDAPVDDATRAQALQLFNDGRAMMQKGNKLDQACATLAQSYELHKRGDTLLNLGECHRRQGRTATAWREFDEAIRYAEAVEFSEAIDAAKSLRDELATHLSRLVVDVPKDARPKGLAVVLDGKPLPSEQWNQELFVDPGKHTVTAKAEGYEPFDGGAEVESKASRTEIKVELKKIPPPPPPPATPKPEPPKKKPEPPAEKSKVPVWSLVVGGAGVALMGVSIGFGVDEVSIGGELDDECGELRKDCPRDYDFKSARSHELRSFGLFVGLGAAGIAATATGVIGLVVGVTKKPPPKVAFVPWATPEGGGFVVSGAIP